MPRIIERSIYYRLKPSWAWELWAIRIGTREEIQQSAASLLESMKDDYPKTRVHIGKPKKRRSK